VRITVALCEVEPGCWHASAPECGGAWGEGATKEEAVEDLRYVIAAWMQVARGLGLKAAAA
jgi:predicted RNase H-like HicB family nuclease